MLIFHCALRRKSKGSRISAKAAQYKRCRVKKGGKPCKYSYVVEGGNVDGRTQKSVIKAGG